MFVRNKKKTRIVIGTGLALLLIAVVAGRIYLPFWLTGYVNRQINALHGYGGQVSDIDVHLWRGAYQIHGIHIYKTKGGLKEPFFAASTVDLSLEWAALFKGAVVAEIDIYNADLNFAKNQTGGGANWPHLVDALSPFDINRLEVHSGKVAYIDHSASPDVNIYIRDITASVKNLRQVTEKNNPLPAPVTVSGTSIGGGKLNLKGKMNILQDTPDFDLDAKLENASLPAFNDYARSFAAIDFKSGHISLYSELAASKGRVIGYVKPLASDVSVDVLHANPLETIWRAAADVFMTIFKNHRTDNFALRIPVSGNLNNPNKDLWSAFLSIFQNTFSHAFIKNTDGNITFNDALREKN